MNWRDHLQARLLDIQPASVCALDPAAHLLASEVLPATPVRMHGQQSSPADALALGIDVLDGLNAVQAQHLISQVRLYIAPRMLLAVQPGCALDAEMLRALGFTLSATDTLNNMRVFDYDLDSYKPVPDWLNARYWAHPERWEP